MGIRHKQAGFTLAELAIVAVLTGLLVGGILAGRSLVTQARIKQIVNDFNGVYAAHLLYVDRYAALPGDDPRAAGRWVGRAKNGTGDGALSGAYNDGPPAGDPMTALTVNAAGGETLNYWWHLRLAELVPFPPPSVTIVAQPLNIFGGVIGVEQNAAGFVVPGVCQANLPGFIAIGVEAQIDDLNTTRGDVRARRQKVPNESLATASVVSGYTEVPDDQYVLCRRLD